MDARSADRFGPAVRARRAELGISMEQLAAASGVSRATLSRIESHSLSTSLANAVAIAEALGRDLGDLLAPARTTVVRAGEGLTYTDPGGIVRCVLARPSPGVEILQFRVPSGARSACFAAHPERTTETVHIIAGRLEYRVGEQRHVLEAGDTLTARADDAHEFASTGDDECLFQLTVISPR